MEVAPGLQRCAIYQGFPQDPRGNARCGADPLFSLADGRTIRAMVIRPFRKDDYEALIGLWNRSELEHRPEGRDSRAALIGELRGCQAVLLVAEEQGRLVGSVLATFDGRKGFINRVGVQPSWRRQGLAQRLVSEAEAALREKGARIITALIYDDNSGSRRLFEHLGYEHWPHVCYYRKVEDEKV